MRVRNYIHIYTACINRKMFAGKLNGRVIVIKKNRTAPSCDVISSMPKLILILSYYKGEGGKISSPPLTPSLLYILGLTLAPKWNG